MITRAEQDATARRVAGLGYTPVLAPLLRVHSLLLRPTPDPAAVLISSSNALPSLPAALHDVPLLAVGDATSERARAAGFRRVSSAGGDAEALLALARISQPPGAALLLATGRGQGGHLAAGLRTAGFRVYRRTVYAAVPVPRLPLAAMTALRADTLQAALFLSAETARIFVRLLPPALHLALARIDALAIGQSAAETLSLLPWRRVRVSVRPTLDDVLALL